MGCGGSNNSDNNTNKKKESSGLYMLAYYCDEDGNYVKELNEITDYDGYPTTELETLYINKKTNWVEIDDEGLGKFHQEEFNHNYDLKLDFEEKQFEYDFIFFDYHYDTDKDAFWYGSDNVYYYFKSCTEEEIDYIKKGKGGSVPIEKDEIGDLVCFGKYDTYPYNEELEYIYWRVIDKKDDKILILADKLIDFYAYNTNPYAENVDQVNWEESTVRKFLNNDVDGFLTMFTEEEINRIETTTVENKAANEELLKQWGHWEDVDGIPYSEQAQQDMIDYPDTQDKVFLLSYQEVLKYFGEPTEEYVGGSDYPFVHMKANSNWKALVTKTVDYNMYGYYDIKTRYGAWMTRTLSTAANVNGERFVTYITSEGQPYSFYTYASMFIRPAMWISTK